MSDSEKSNEKQPFKTNRDEKSEEEEEIRNIKETLAKHVYRVECGAVVKIEGIELVEEDEVFKMRTSFIYGIVSNLEKVCELTNSKAYQIDWAISHVTTGNSFLSFAAPYFEHVFEVVKFEEEEDDMEDEEFTKLFQNVDGNWTAIQTYKCEFC